MELFLFALTTLARLVTAQYPPPPQYDAVIKSPIDPGVTVSFKSPAPGTCTTAFTTQKQYSGYITLPPFTLAPIQQNYTINTFFWFIEARQTPETAPLTIWLNGGPGSSSMVGLFQENGPCEVVQTGDGSYGTQPRMWGWDRSSNILYIDQPNQVGFSFDTATNGTWDFWSGLMFENGDAPERPKVLLRDGTFSSSDGAASFDGSRYINTANTTQIAAQATWHFLQSWLSAFPQYNPVTRPNVTTVNTNKQAAGVHLFAESYGGHYGPAFATFFQQQNARRSNGSLPSNSSLAIELKSLGILNGLVDELTQDYYYATFPYNNTYGISVFDLSTELNLIASYSGSGGCAEAINACRNAMSSTDPGGEGDERATNELCTAAQLTCSGLVAAYTSTGYDPYDIRQRYPSPDPGLEYAEYLNNETVLAAIGAQVNYTESSRYVQYAFISTGDTIRGGQAQQLATLVHSGVRVAFIYGDADFLCNWQGGEAVSLQVASLSPQGSASDALLNTPVNPYSTAFPAAGYADIVVNGSYVGGAVRQYGNLSFSRIYDAGHFVPFFQPETAFTVFTRIIEGTDIATGEVIDLSTYGSTGPANATHTQSSTLLTPSPTCWQRDVNDTCSGTQIQAILGGNGQFLNGIYYENDEIPALPTSSVTAGVPGSPPNSGRIMSDTAMSYTGVYTATGTPSPSGAASCLMPDRRMALWPVASLFLAFGLGGAVVLL